MSQTPNVLPKVIITGAGGMAGQALVRGLAENFDCIGFSSQPCPDGILEKNWRYLNILDASALKVAVNEIRPAAVVHAASSVFVNECEKPSERDAIYKLHVELTQNLAQICDPIDSQLIYISTESVYDGEKQGLYVETDAPRPLNYYAQTKLWGEEPVRAMKKGLVLRTNILGWRTDSRESFLQWVLDGLTKREKRTMFTDVTFTPVSTYQLTDDIRDLIKHGLSGLFHAGGAESVSKYDLAVALARKLTLDTNSLVPITIDDISMGARRPKNTSLDSTRLSAALKRPRPSINETLERFLLKR